MGSPSPAESLVDAPAAPAAPASEPRRRVARLLLLRTIVITVVLGLSMWLVSSGAQPTGPAVWVQSGVIAATYLSSVVFGVLLRVGLAPHKVARPMWVVDLSLTSVFVYVTGGAQSPYTFLYALSIVSAGALSYRRGAVTITIASIGALIVVSLLAWRHALDLPMAGRITPWEQTSTDLARTLGIQLVALTGVGALGFIFGDQLEKGAETLATTRKAAADLLVLHQHIVRSLASGLITIAPDGVVLTVNGAAGEILGRPGDQLVGRSIEHAMPGLLAQVERANGELRRADLTLDGLVVGVSVSALRDLDDRVIGRVINFQDLTELRRLELHMQRAERLAMVGRLAAGVAHEIRNPLASISGSIELLRATPQASDDDRALMAIVHREIQRLNELIGDLLDYANPRPIQPVAFDLGVLVRETLQVARGDQAFAEVEVTAEVDDPLPITADPAKLRQVLWNLLRNAAEAAATAGKHVRVEAHRAGDDATIVVTDDGPGIAADQLTRIFEPFFTTKRKGTGLGLAQCHAIVAEHGGRLDVDSALGKGTRMVVRLPIGALS